MTDAVPPAAAARLLAATADAVLLVGDGVVVRSWPDAALPGFPLAGTPLAGLPLAGLPLAGLPLAGLPLADLVHPDDDLPVPPPPGAVARLRLRAGEHRWCEVTGVEDPDGCCWLTVRDVHDRVEAERGLRRRLRRTLRAVDVTLDGLAIYSARRDARGNVCALELSFINATGARAFTSDAAGLIGQDLGQFWPASRSNGLWDALVRALETGETVWARIEAPGNPWSGVTEGVTAPLDTETVVCSWRDATAGLRQQELLARAYEETAHARAALQTALNATSDSFAVYEVERDGAGQVRRIVVRLANVAAAEPLGFTPEEIVGQDLSEAFPELRACGLWDAIVESVTAGEPRRHRVHMHDDEGVWTTSFDNTIAPVTEDQVVVTWRDVTRDELGRRHLEQTRSRAEHAATHDHLTGLPNRALLEHRLAEALEAPGDGLVGVVFCDLDEFKSVNDTYGHRAGDLVLSAVAQRLNLLTRHGETAARLAGDEFVLLLRDLPVGWRPEEFLRRADSSVRRPVDVGPAAVTPSASLGVVLVDPRVDRRSPRALLDEADRAMYQVKRGRAAGQSPA